MCNGVIEKILSAALKMVSKNKIKGESSPALGVASSFCYGGESVGNGSSQLCLWAEISTGTWMVFFNVIEK